MEKFLLEKKNFKEEKNNIKKFWKKKKIKDWQNLERKKNWKGQEEGSPLDNLFHQFQKELSKTLGKYFWQRKIFKRSECPRKIILASKKFSQMFSKKNFDDRCYRKRKILNFHGHFSFFLDFVFQV